ncbi:sugar-binding transcriptional regulator [Vagococcus entomophilus]|uniref:Sugar-binding protein n=1 Tax=Vagococcus entomophilus TaxID=1160095 RepID=A0A430AIQ5_9ENTE|nr:sugar-binding transcriptional regulator [Vagococcus entomophilus]RSU07797.1 sugar-binding protein [Vagococcus entomophilus]
MRSQDEQRKLVKIATLYYEHGYTQAKIAKEFGVSRPVIAKLLQQAKEEKIVSIQLNDTQAYTVGLALNIQKKYQLKEVIVLPSSMGQETIKIRQTVAKAGANYIASHLATIQTIGLSWGTTLADMVECIPFGSWPDLKIQPLVGGISSEHVYFDTNHLVFCLAEKLSAHCRYFYAPALAENLAFAEMLNGTKIVQTTLKGAKSVDLAVIGVGNPQVASTWENLGYIGEEEFKSIGEMEHVVGDAVGSLFDAQGKTIQCDLTKRMIGVKVEELTEIKEVMIIAAGQEKAKSILALVKANRANTLIVDQQLAEKIWEEGQ